MPAYQALEADMIPREKRGRIMGTIGTLNVMATIPASTLAGLLYSLDPAEPFVFSLILGITVSLIVLFLVRDPKSERCEGARAMRGISEQVFVDHKF